MSDEVGLISSSFKEDFLMPIIRAEKPIFVADKAIFEVPELSSLAKLIYLYLSSLMNAESECTPTLDEIAKAVSCSTKTATKAIKELVSLGIVEKESQYSEDSGQKANRYTVYSFTLAEEGNN